MTRARTRGDLLRRFVAIRLALSILWVLAFLASLVFGFGVAVSIALGVFAVLWIGLTGIHYRAYRRTAPVVLSMPIDPSRRASLGYLRPAKYRSDDFNEP